MHDRWPLAADWLKRYRKRAGRQKLRNPYTPEHFAEIARRCPEPRIVVEFGAACGVWAGQVLKQFPSIERFFAIDPWLPPPTMPGSGVIHPRKVHRHFFFFCPRWQVSVAPWLFTKAFPLVGKSADWGRLFPFQVDLLYVDGDHSYQAALEDLKIWWPKVSPGGLCVVDNMGMKTVQRAVAEYFGRPVEVVDRRAFVVKE